MTVESQGQEGTKGNHGRGTFNSRGLQAVYLSLAVLGAVLPWLANLEFIKVHGGGFDLGLFISLANANAAAQSLSRDLLISSTAVSIWIVVEARRLKMRGLMATLLLCFGVAFACGAPFFLYLRERRLRELSQVGQSH
ncbi:MAG: DUF2834 domain-containing protein [Cyanobacteriota bacterium]